MRTLSARILVGFAALGVAFAVITVTLIFNLRLVEREIRMVRQGYVPLFEGSKELELRQEDLRSTLDEGAHSNELTVLDVRVNVTNARLKRDASITSMRHVVGDLERTGDLNTARLAELRTDFEELQASITVLKPLYDRLLRDPPDKNETLESPPIAEAIDQLKIGERTVAALTRQQASRRELVLRSTTTNLEENENRLVVWTSYFGLIAMVLGILITAWLVITLRPLRRLRDAARKVAAGDYASRIPERGPTEVKDLARELNSMARAVEEREKQLIHSERLAATSELARFVTHEVRNPLSAIGLNTELLDEELAKLDNSEGRELCRAIHREIDRLTAMTEEYLAIGQLPKPKLAYEPVNPMVASLASFVREDLAQQQVELHAELDSAEPVAMIDAGQIRSCLINLVRNASQAVASKGAGHVTVRTRREGERVVIEVEDDGVGISPELLPKLFDKFFSTKEGGSGLGLALTQQIVKDHGGDLSVDSVVGRGTTFKLSIPAAK